MFNATSLQLIALHHAGGEAIRRLNGKADAWPANEGIWIKSIIDAINKPEDAAATLIPARAKLYTN